MDLRQLRYFTVLAEELHFRRAAERLHITQAPLSVAIQQLEREVGGQLFHRNRRRVALTELGLVLLEHGEAILARVDQGLAHVREIAQGHAGRLRIGFTPASSLLPVFQRAIGIFSRRYPEVELSLREFSSLGQLTAISKREIDVGVIRSHALVAPADIATVMLLRDPLVVAMHRGHPLSRRTSVGLADLRGLSLVFYPAGSGVGIYEHFIGACERAGFAPSIAHEALEASTVVGLAACGLGVAVVPAELQCLRLANIVFRPIDDVDAMTELLLAYRAGEQSALVAQFLHIARASDGAG